MVEAGAVLRFIARLVCLPLYGSGVPGVRSSAFGLSLVGLLLTGLGLL